MALYDRLKKNMFVRNAILAICLLIVMVFVAGILLNFITRHGQSIEVPNFSGMTMAEAAELADNERLDIEINDSLFLPLRTGGVILEQNPSPGAKVKSGRRIFVTINAFKPKMAVIPYVSGYSLRQAKNNLEVAGFTIKQLVYISDLATNNVLEQKHDGRSIGPNSKVEAPTGSGITLVVGMSGENSSVKIPKVIGFPLGEAKSRLWEVGLNVGEVDRDNDITEITIGDARVYRQNPNQGGYAQLGTPITLFMTLDTEKMEKGSKESDRAAKSAIVESAKEGEEE